ncbi:MAG: PEP-CTERM sorting domain-containing protein [Emcibacter sp.]|nr:PEP-CTERM sorting domain-containing protein [Emcibacter sp.]
MASAALVYPGDANWANPGIANGGGGSSAITNAAPRSGNGSLELHGDRTRFFGLGDPENPSSNLMLLSEVNNFTYDWMIDPSSVSALHVDYTPALRLHIWDGNQKSELIWEGAYNNTYGNTTKGDWQTSSADDFFWRWETGIGFTLLPGGAQANLAISDWANSSNLWYSANAYVAGISVGVGSSAGGSYYAFADNVILNDQTFNFEVRNTVPEPAMSALFGLSLIGFGIARKRRK